MKSLLIVSAMVASSAFANTTALEQFSVIDEHALSDERGMYLVHDDQDNLSVQHGEVNGAVINSLTGFNAISQGAFNGAHGIMMINLSSGNNNVTNMNTNVNIISVR